MTRKRPKKSAAPPATAPGPDPAAPVERSAWLLWLAGGLVCVACAWPQLSTSWHKWADVQVDFGRELYTPWRLSEGDSLYRDVSYFNGPLSPVVNEWFFRLFGASYSTLIGVNLLVLALACVLLARLFRRTDPSATAVLAPLTLLGVFAFQHLTFYGNYNWLSPYSHEMTHGLTLSLGLLLVLVGRRKNDSGRRWIGAGVLLGLVFLTKAEVFLAAAAGALAVWSLRPGTAGRGASLLRLGLGAVAPVALAWGLLAASIGAGPALRGTLGSWPSIVAGEVSELTFYSRGIGLDEPWSNLAGILKWSAILLGLLAPVAVLERRIQSAGTRTFVGGVAGLIYLVWSLRAEVPWTEAARPLPLLVSLALAWTLWSMKKCGAAELRDRLVARAAVLAFSLVLLLKMLLNTRVHHYGFVLAMPAMACVVVCLAGWLPEALAGRRARSFGLSLATVGIFLGMSIGLSQMSAVHYRDKAWPVGRSGEHMYGDRVRGQLFQMALDELEERFPGDATMVVMPEGVTLNYWSRRTNPTPYINFMPPEFILYGEEEMIASLERAPPDLVVLTHKDTTEYGPPLFGTDYGQKLYQWVRDHYDREHVIGNPPLQRVDLHGVEILSRKP